MKYSTCLPVLLGFETQLAHDTTELSLARTWDFGTKMYNHVLRSKSKTRLAVLLFTYGSTNTQHCRMPCKKGKKIVLPKIHKQLLTIDQYCAICD
jgi:hypothetical protein